MAPVLPPVLFDVSAKQAARADACGYLRAALGGTTVALAQAVRAAHFRLLEEGVVSPARTALWWAHSSLPYLEDGSPQWDVAARFALALLQVPAEVAITAVVVVVPSWPSAAWRAQLVELLAQVRAAHGIDVEVNVTAEESAAGVDGAALVRREEHA